MDFLMEMSTLPRHGHLVGSLFSEVYEMFKKKELYPLQEQHSLVYFGERFSGFEILVDLDNLESIEEFKNVTIENLCYIQPDFFVFKHNPYVHNKTTSRVAGIPDLVVEVWSDYNTLAEKDMKQRIYSSSPKCEHWYLSQSSNDVMCFIGKNQILSQNLHNPLITQNGLKLDLRHLAL